MNTQAYSVMLILSIDNCYILYIRVHDRMKTGLDAIRLYESIVGFRRSCFDFNGGNCVWNVVYFRGNLVALWR